MTRLTVLPEENDVRLDRVLERLLPDMGLRGRRRLCELGLVEVNGRPAPPSRKMRPGDAVEVREAAPADAPTPSAETLATDAHRNRLFPEDNPRLVTRTPHLAAVYKPASMHTEALAGKPGVTDSPKGAYYMETAGIRMAVRDTATCIHWAKQGRVC